MIKKIKSKLSQDKHLSDLISSSVISFGLRILGIGMGYLFIVLLSRHLGAAAVGIFTLSFTVLQITSIVGRFGLDTALLRFIAESNVQGNMGEAKGTYIQATRFAFLTALFLSILLYLFAETIAVKVFGNVDLVLSFQMASLGIIPMTLTYLNFETLRAMKKIREYAFLQNVSTFLFATIILFFMLEPDTTANETIIAFISAVFISWSLSQYWILKMFKGFISTEGRKLISMLKTALPMMVASSLMLVMGWTDTIMIGIFMDESSVGVYSVALKVATVTSITLMAINSMAAPKFAEFYSKNDMSALQHIVTHSSRLIFWTSLPILLITVLFPEAILGIFGQEFETAAWALIILCFGQFVNAASGSVGYILQMTGNEKIFQYIIMCSLAINIVLNYLFIPIYGLNGAALASAISLATWNLLSVYITKNKVNIMTLYIVHKKYKGDL